MTCKSKYEKLIAGETVNFTLQHTTDDNQRIEVKINLNNINDGPFTVNLTVSKSSISLYKKAKIEIEESCDDGSINLSICLKKYCGLEISGTLEELRFNSTEGKIDTISYDLPNSQMFPLHRHTIKWSSILKSKDYSFAIIFNLTGSSVKAYFPREVDVLSSDYTDIKNHVEDNIKVLASILSFCRSTPVEWEQKFETLQKEIINFHFIKAITSKNFPNLINPMRQDTSCWNNLITHVMNSNIKFAKLHSTGIYQAICNLKWTNIIDEWVLIRHVAALEGICRENQPPQPISDNLWKKVRQCVRAYLKFVLKEHDVDDCMIGQIADNFNSSSRVINGYPLKWHVRNILEKLNLTEYYNENKTDIDNAINTRNKIVHEGWNPKWEKDIWWQIVSARNLIYILVLRKLKYRGALWLCNETEKISIEDCV